MQDPALRALAARDAPSDFSGEGIALAFGRSQTGAIVHISEVRSGLACGCACPACGARLVARRGAIRAHHFGHYEAAECRYAAETALHGFAKHVLLTYRRLLLPAAVAATDARQVEVATGREVAVDNAALEQRLGDVVPDVIVTVRGRTLLVEIAVTHFCRPAKLARIRALGLPAIEIDLSAVARDAGPRAIAAAILRDGPRRWLFNERVEAARARLEIEERRAALRRRDLRAQQVEAIVAAATPLRRAELAEEAAVYGDGLVGRAFAGDWCLGERRAWQEEILRCFVRARLDAPAFVFTSFATRDALDQLCRAGLLDPRLGGFIDEAMAAAVSARVPGFAAPYRIVDAYLATLAAAGVLVQLGRRWSVSQLARRRLGRL
jgi:hypothetical protein